MSADDPLLNRMKDSMTHIAGILGKHPAAPLMGRVVVYWLLIAFILVLVVATSNTPIRYFTVIGGALAVSILVFKIRRRLNTTRRFLRSEQPKPKGLISGMFGYVRDAKTITQSQKHPPSK
jgi:hypothetical protein